MNPQNKISVILPTYNERNNIEDLIASIRNILNYQPEVIIIDDDSPDGTWRIAEEISKKEENIKLIRRRGRAGLASALREGIAAACGDIIVWMDSDFSMPPEVIAELIKALEENDIVVGSRYVGNGADKRKSVFRIFSSRFFNNFAARVLHSSIKDLTSGFLAVKREVLNKIGIYGKHGEYCVSFLYRAQKAGLKIKEIPYCCMPRRYGKSKTNSNLFRFIGHGIKYFYTIFNLRLTG